MVSKVEEVKSILKQLNVDVYNEWGIILSVLHPPHHHIREQRIQKDLVRRFYGKNFIIRDRRKRVTFIEISKKKA